MAESEVRKTGKDITDICPGGLFYIIITSFHNVNVHLPNHQKGWSCHKCNSQNSPTSKRALLAALRRTWEQLWQHYQRGSLQTPANHLNQMAEHEAVKQGTKIPSKWMCTRTCSYTPCLKNTVRPFGHAHWGPRLSGVHLRPMKVAKHRTDLLNNRVRGAHSAPYWARPTTGYFAASETNKMIAVNIIDQATTELVLPIQFAPKKDRLVWFSIEYR